MKVITKKVVKRELVLSFFDKKEKRYYEEEFHTMSTEWKKEIKAYVKTKHDSKYLGFTIKDEHIFAVSMNIDRFIEYADEIVELGKEDLENVNESEEN